MRLAVEPITVIRTMNELVLAQYAVLVVFTLNALLVVVLITAKAFHRRQMARHESLYSQHVAAISRHLAFPDDDEAIDSSELSGPAFLDALIDVRNAVGGPEVDTVRGLVKEVGVVQDLSDALKAKYPRGRRLRAAVALAELGDESSARLLMEHIGDDEPEVRVQSARGLGRMHWTPAIDRIVEQLGIEEPWVRSRFADTLVGFGSLATPPLSVYLRVNHLYEPAGAVSAMTALAAIGDREAVPTILEVAEESKNIEVVLTAIESLGFLGGPLTAPTMKKAILAENWRVRAKAATALGDIGFSQAGPILARSLRDRNFWVRRNSASALKRLEGGTELLLNALEGDDPYAADAAAEALVDRGDLAQARERVSEGTATAGDFRLLAFIDEDELVDQ